MSEKNKTIKALLFDKDGTIFDYSRIWFSVLQASISEVFRKEGRTNQKKNEQMLLRLLGLDQKGNTLAHGAIFSHNKSNIFIRGLVYCIKAKMLPSTLFKISEKVVKTNDQYISEKLQSLDFRKQKEFFKKLNEKGYKIGIITADRRNSLDIFLTDMGIKEYIDFISTKDDCLPAKPNPKSFKIFCEKFGFSSNEVAFIGDTLIDMKFAKRAKSGLIISVLWGGYEREKLTKYCDEVYENIFEIYKNPLIFSQNN